MHIETMCSEDASLKPETVRPLVVDLDGTLIFADMLRQDMRCYVGTSLIRFFRCLSWAIKGRAFIKSKLAEFSLIDYQSLKMNKDVIELVVRRKSQGSKIILMTGSDQKHANQVAKLCGVFDETIGSSCSVNMIGSRKRTILVRRYGVRGYDYVGNSRQDIAVWRSAECSYATNLGVVAAVIAYFFKIDLRKLDGVPNE